MNWVKSFILFILLFLQPVTFSQDRVKTKTLAIIDTSKSRLEQVHEIYTWITNNIKYDVKAYLHGDYTYKSADEIIRKRKGICKDYSELFNEMCHYAGIESYTVVGYVKDPNYWPGDNIYRSNHCWNAVYIDSLWYVADLTWGSSNLKRVPTSLDRFKHLIFNTPIVNRRLVFVKLPDNKWFNPLPNEFLKIHLPLDPKWQMRYYPISIYSLENDTFDEIDHFTDYKNELKSGKGLALFQQLYFEGIKGKEFNWNNDFDIGFGYLQLAKQFNDRELYVDNKSVKLFLENFNLYKKAGDFINKYQYVIDSLSKKRLALLKKEEINGKRIISFIQKVNNDGNKTLIKKQIALEKRNAGINTRIVKLQNWLKSDIKIREVNRKDTIKHYDPEYFHLNLSSLSKSIGHSEQLKSEIESLIQICCRNMLKDSVLSSICMEKKFNLTKWGLGFDNQIITDEKSIIYPVWDTIKLYYQHVNEHYKLKAQNVALIKVSLDKINERTTQMIWELLKQLEFIGKLNKYYLDSLLSSGLTDSLITMFKETCFKVVVVLQDYNILNDRLINFYFKDDEFNKTLATSPLLNIRKFVKYNAELFLEQKNYYTNEKKVTKEVYSQCVTPEKRISDKLENYNLLNNKKVWGK